MKFFVQQAVLDIGVKIVFAVVEEIDNCWFVNDVLQIF